MVADDNFREKVREQADIVRVVSEHVTLKKKGGRYWGCCPFHNEKTPSFTVDEQRGFYKCFGCGAGGDVFSFVMAIEHKSFPEALNYLAEKFGVPIPENKKSPREIAREKEAKEIYEANEWAAKFYHAVLCNTDLGKEALKYLHGRGITDEIINSFNIGFAPDDYHRMHTALVNQKGVREDTLAKAGLATRNERGIYDRFRRRIMIPIMNPRGKIVGFGGRILGDGEPKYLNTAETEWFSKRNTLFGMNVALKAINQRKQVVVVEGYMDAISLHAAGIDWAVAALGTAFSKEHAQLIKRLTEDVVFSFDSDGAGITAALRAVPIALEAGLHPRVLVVTKGKDPDEFIRENGREAFEKLIAESPEGIAFQLSRIMAGEDITSLAGKLRVVTAAIPILAQSGNEVEIGQYISSLAVRLNVDEGLIRSEFEKHRGRKGAVFDSGVAVPRPDNMDVGTQAERILLYVLSTADIKAEDRERYIEKLQKIGISGTERQEIFAKLVARQGETKSGTNELFAELSPEASGELAGILALDMDGKNLVQAAEDSIFQLETEYLEKEFRRHSRLAAEYEKENPAEFLKELAECQRIKNMMKDLHMESKERREQNGAS